ncbi:MAG: hypothetical protein EPN41_03125 [Candidimonas sp.]|nr:MAG: hypothetical protein EPN41_03125 [Candidimonas sp.]
MVELARVVLVLVYWYGVKRFAPFPRDAHPGTSGGCMNKHAKTDWDRVRREADEPVPYDPAVDPYDPNSGDAVEAFWKRARVIRRGRPPVAIRRPTLNMRVDADVLEHLRASGRGWQTRVNAILRDAVKSGRL